jgi:hypothetical protein
MAEWYHRGLCKDAAVTSSYQHSTAYFRNITPSFREDNQDLFYTSNIDVSLLSCDYLPVKYLEDRAELLSRGSESEVDPVLGYLPEKKHNNSSHHDGDNIQVHEAQEIVWRIDRALPVSPPSDRQWVQQLLQPAMAAGQVANSRGEQMTFSVEIIPFNEFERFGSPAIVDLLQLISDIRHESCARLAADTALRSKIERINEVVSIMTPLSAAGTDDVKRS